MLIVLVTDFWGPASNFGIPIAAIADMSKDPEMCVFTSLTVAYIHPLHPLLSHHLLQVTSYQS